MKNTLLEMTQNILSRMSSDEVNSISDTVESLQVANIIKNKYFDIINRVNLPEHDQLIQLDPSLDATQPVLMFVPAGVGDIKWIKYFDASTSVDSDSDHDINVNILDTDSDVSDSTPGYQYVTILPVQQFVDMTNKFNPDDSTVDSFIFTNSVNGFPGTYTFYYKDDIQPRFCTIISNLYIIFDSYDSSVDSTLQSSKTMAWGRVIPQFLMVDGFIPDLAEEQFQLLINEATALAFFELKQQPHQLASQEVQRGWSNIQKNKAVTNRPTYFNELPNFGRSGRGFNSNSSYFKSRGWDV